MTKLAGCDYDAVELLLVHGERLVTPPEFSITEWLRSLHAGEATSMQNLWERFFEELVKAADNYVRSLSVPLVDGEDIAASVFESIWRGGQAGRFKDLQSLDELWWLLLGMARKKCLDYRRKAQAKKRGKSSAVELSQETAEEMCKSLISQLPDPQYIAMLNEQYAQLVGNISDSQRRNIAVLRIEGYTIAEIAKKLKISLATVNRKLEIIRAHWAAELRHEQLG